METIIIKSRIKILIIFFMASLIVSGLTAFPIESEMNIANFFNNKKLH